MKKIWVILLLALLTMSCVGHKAGKFEIGKNTFLLNGEPFVVMAAEMHYPRIPREYWEHRIEMCKALGMNTICLYVFWNLHEQNPGEFDFSGNKDIAAFCRLAQKHGMYVIVRPGPYVCAEWEMGGLPWWLLKNDNVQLRTQDAFYMKHVGRFMHEVGKELSGLQITNGGNIIMVQVENEYGSYATDKAYVSAIRDTVRAAGFTEVPLFQCDWSSNFLNNGLDDLLWTVNFGTGANIDAQFDKLKEVRPESPLMCSEYWSGWFDHWGRMHETRDARIMVDGLQQMLERGISFSLYMTHGGTTFGHWGGANNPAYSAMCSSYDYDAPISEAGWATDKYYLLRNMLKGYQPAGKGLPDVPAALPVMSFPQIEFNEVAPMVANLGTPVEVEKIRPMEQFDQGWGCILYRTVLKEDVNAGTVMKITEQHDWTQVYADGKRLACLDRRKGEQECTLPALKQGTRIDLLVEAMGRVNFDISIHDRKGITERIELVDENASKELMDWEVYCFPVAYDFVSNKKYFKLSDWTSKIDEFVPAYYRTTFNLDKVADTYLDMSTWGKGMVWVNGHAIGRFWEIGPQQTLFMPGCWLKKGENEIIVLDLKGPESTIVRGLGKPILDHLRAEIDNKPLRTDETWVSDLDKPVYEGMFARTNGWKQVVFPQVDGRYFCIEALSSYDMDGVIAIAELDVLDDQGARIPRKDWSIVYADSEETNHGNCTADKVYDLQESTYWQTSREVKGIHRIVINLGKSCRVSGFRLLPRAEQGVPEMIKEYKIHVW